jgi:hypothetical protein
MRKRLFSLFVLLTCAGPALAQEPNIHPPYVLKRFDLIKTPATYFRWKQIPWLTKISDGLETAKKENRPLLIWGADDDPLDRC